MDLIIKNGRLVMEDGLREGDLWVRDGRIAGIGDLEVAGAQVLDASGCYVFPGFIDAHTHLDMECAAGVTADDFPSGTRAAVSGGTTTILDFATQDKGWILEKARQVWAKKAEGKAYCDYGFHMAITDWTDNIPEQMEQMCRLGLTSFKVYLAYDNLRLTPEQVGMVLKTAARLGAVVACHCEDGDAVNAGIAAQKAQDHFGPDAHPLSRPNGVEAQAVAQFLRLAKEAGAEAYVVHLSTREGLEEIRKARAEGQTVWAETCPSYLTMTDEVYRLPDFEGAKYVCSPPIRSEKDRDVLRKALQDGEIQVVATDHCSFRFQDQKTLGKEDFSQIPNGLPSIEHRGLVMYGLSQGDCPLSPEKLAQVLATNPAKIYGLYPQKGAIRLGADGDLVVWDPKAPKTVRASEMYMNTDYTPLEGQTFPGSPRYVLLRGVVAAEKGVVKDSPQGQFVPRKTR